MQYFTDQSGDLHISALLVSKAETLFLSIAQAVASVDVQLRWGKDAADGIAIAREARMPVVLAACDSDWRRVTCELSSDEIKPSVIVLSPRFERALWPEALNLGAFEVLAMSDGRDRLLWTVAAGYRSWERKQLVKAALMQNPYAHAS
jgi:hypothetical protein